MKQAERATQSKALWVNKRQRGPWLDLRTKTERQTVMARENDPTHLSPKFNITSKHMNVIFLFFLRHGGGTQTERGVEQRETTGHQESCGQNKKNGYCTWDHSRPMSVRKQIGFWSH